MHKGEGRSLDALTTVNSPPRHLKTDHCPIRRSLLATAHHLHLFGKAASLMTVLDAILWRHAY